MSLTPAFLDELRARTTLSALVGKSVKLTKAGRQHKGCCPFHNEKTPSFYVNDDKGFYHCFGCSAHGDAIRWLTDQQGLSFMDAVKELAATAGLEMPAPDPQFAARADQHQTLYDVMAKAAAWFQTQLNDTVSEAAQAYLKSRNIPPALAQHFGIGWSPDNRNGLKVALAQFNESKLIEAGLLILVEGKPSYDRFRGRIIIPIKDPRGRVIGFGGRILGAGEPKYLNSPDTPLFDKGRTLFNIHLAAPAAHKAKRIIVVEGYMDVIALAKAGIDEVVAPLGTAVTETQLERLWRQSPAPILCFDGDGAGQKAAARAALRALPMVAPNRTLQFITLPEGQDPDDLVRDTGRAGMESLLATPQPLVDRLWQIEQQRHPLTTPEARAGLRQRLNELAKLIADIDTRAQYLRTFHERFDALFTTPPRTAQNQRYNSTPQQLRRRGQATIAPAAPLVDAQKLSPAHAHNALECALLAGLMRYPDMIATHYERVSRLRFDHAPHQKLHQLLLDTTYVQSTLDSQAIITICETHGLTQMREAILKPASRQSQLLYSFARDGVDEAKAKQDLAAALEMLTDGKEINAALKRTSVDFGRDTDEQNWTHQQTLRYAAAQAHQSLADRGQMDEDI